MMSIKISPEAEVMKDLVLDIGELRPFVMIEALCSILIDYMDAFIENIEEGGFKYVPEEEYKTSVKVQNRKN